MTLKANKTRPRKSQKYFSQPRGAGYVRGMIDMESLGITLKHHEKIIGIIAEAVRQALELEV